MKLNELPNHFWTDSRTDALERQKVVQITKDFRKTLKDKGVPYRLYGLTITAQQKSVRDADIWFDDDARNDLLSGIYKSFIHRISSAIEPNYKRNTHAHKRFISWGVIEHASREKRVCDRHGSLVSERVTPHIHATIAVHPDWEEKFLSCFQRNLCRDHYSLSPDFISKGMTTWMKQVSSVRLEPVWDEYEWSDYCLKQVPHHSQTVAYEQMNTGLFSHNGLTKKPNNKKEISNV